MTEQPSHSRRPSSAAMRGEAAGASTVAANVAQLAVLQQCQRILVADGGATTALTVSWCASEDPDLDRLMPVQWLMSGRDPETLLLQARRDAHRLDQCQPF
jgi:hypothetical protein